MIKKLLPFSFDYVILKTLNAGPSKGPELTRVCHEFFKDAMSPEVIGLTCVESIRKLTSIEAIEIKSNQATSTDFITIKPYGVSLITAAYKEVAREFHELEKKGKVE